MGVSPTPQSEVIIDQNKFEILHFIIDYTVVKQARLVLTLLCSFEPVL